MPTRPPMTSTTVGLLASTAPPSRGPAVVLLCGTGKGVRCDGELWLRTLATQQRTSSSRVGAGSMCGDAIVAHMRFGPGRIDGCARQLKPQHRRFMQPEVERVASDHAQRRIKLRTAVDFKKDHIQHFRDLVNDVWIISEVHRIMEVMRTDDIS
uniref:Uncharacterized protein n=1 Tax=Arundo donax TaxID=35708 RepID=A0A0A9FLG6_ARUDO